MTTIIDTYFLLAPDWKFSIEVGRSWKTIVTTTKKGYEQRSGLKNIPRRSIKFTCVNLKASLTNYGYRKLYQNLDKVFGIPIWVDGTELSSAASINDMILYIDSHQYREFEVGGKLVLLDVDDPTVYEVCTITSLDNSGEIEINSPLTLDWGVNTEVFPILTSRIKSAIDVSMITDRYNQFEIMAEETDEVYAIMTTTTSTTTTSTTSTSTTTISATNTISNSTTTTTSTCSTTSTTVWPYYDNVNDDFTGNDNDPPNSILWTESDTNNKMSIQSNKLEFDSQESVDISSSITSNYYLTGDFDLQIDLEILNFGTPSLGAHSSRIYINDGSNICIILAGEKSASPNTYFRCNSTLDTNIDISRSISSTKLRLTRNGSVIKAYYWSGSQWEWNGNTNGYTFTDTFTGDVFVACVFVQEGSGSTRWNSTFDNYTLNSGTILWP